MEVIDSYKYRQDDVVGVGQTVPNDAEILVEMKVLVAQSKHHLVRKSDNKDIGSSLWLKDGDTQDNYTEVEVKDDNKHRR